MANEDYKEAQELLSELSEIIREKDRLIQELVDNVSELEDDAYSLRQEINDLENEIRESEMVLDHDVIYFIDLYYRLEDEILIPLKQKMLPDVHGHRRLSGLMENIRDTIDTL